VCSLPPTTKLYCRPSKQRGAALRSEASLGTAKLHRAACRVHRERGTWKAVRLSLSVRQSPDHADPPCRSRSQGAGISGQDSCVTMQMALGSFLLFWIGYVLWATWELKHTRDAQLLHRQPFATQPDGG
jgi:hypothetical protein